MILKSPILLFSDIIKAKLCFFLSIPLKQCMLPHFVLWRRYLLNLILCQCIYPLKKIVFDFDWNINLWLDLWLEYDFYSSHEWKQQKLKKNWISYLSFNHMRTNSLKVKYNSKRTCKEFYFFSPSKLKFQFHFHYRPWMATQSFTTFDVSMG